MAADINTQLQNITTDVTAISNLVNRLVTIFSGGGVQNPDIAVAKAELQGWTTTQLGSYVTLNTNQTVTGIKYFTENLVLRDFSHTLKENINIEKSLRLLDKNGSLSGYLNFVKKGFVSSVEIATYGYNPDNDEFTKAACSLSVQSDGTSGFYVPTILNLNASGREAINANFLNNIGNSVVHKTGTEYISGVKHFENYSVFDGRVYLNTFSVSSDDTTAYYGDIAAIENKTGKKAAAANSLMFAFGNQLGTDYKLGDLSFYLDYDSAADDYYVSTFLQNKRFASGANDVVSIKLVNYKEKTQFNRVYVSHPLHAYGYIAPGYNNQYSCGTADYKWTQVYSSNGTIQTSDKNLKTEISDIPESVLRAWGKIKFQQFKMKEAVERKGSNNARIHIGVIANELAHSIKKAFESEGLSPEKYGLFCYDAWEERKISKKVVDRAAVYTEVEVVDQEAVYEDQYDNEGNKVGERLVSDRITHKEVKEIEPERSHEEIEVIPAGSSYSVRYEECLALECAYQRWRLDQLETKIR